MGIPLVRYLDDLVSLFYPRLCLACSKNLPPKELAICLPCQYHLPKTNYHLEAENPFTERFDGRIPIRTGAALYHFIKKGKVQQLIHHLKYKQQKNIGLKLGTLYGHHLKKSEIFQTAQLIVPVPLHPRKEKIRGYNQSDLFAQGLSESMQIPWAKNALQRTSMSDSQTKKTRLERLANVRTAFSVNHPDQLMAKHVLLVDDVLTTGATLEACGEKILEIKGCSLSLATIAIAE